MRTNRPVALEMSLHLFIHSSAFFNKTIIERVIYLSCSSALKANPSLQSNCANLPTNADYVSENFSVPRKNGRMTGFFHAGSLRDSFGLWASVLLQLFRDSL